jgi:Kelch motif
MPKPRSGFASCVKRDEGKIFFCGGNSGSVLRKFDCLDLKKGKWSRLPEMIKGMNWLFLWGLMGKFMSSAAMEGAVIQQFRLTTLILIKSPHKIINSLIV